MLDWLAPALVVVAFVALQVAAWDWKKRDK
jgi:hypothetical protein